MARLTLRTSPAIMKSNTYTRTEGRPGTPRGSRRIPSHDFASPLRRCDGCLPRVVLRVRAGAGLPQPRYPDRCSVAGGRPGRYRRSHRGRCARQIARPIDSRRERPRSGGKPRCRAGGEGGARRPHAADGDQLACDRRRWRAQGAVRSAKDLVPVALVADTNNVVIVPAASPFKSVADLIAAAKAKPGELSFGTPGIGSPSHLFSELFAQSAGVKMLHVPYSRTPAINDLIGGRLSVMFATIPVAMPQIAQRHRARACGDRHRALPDVARRADGRGVRTAGLRRRSVGRRVRARRDACRHRAAAERRGYQGDEHARRRAAATGARHDPVTATPAEFAKRFADDVRKWGAVVRASDIKLE